nr:proline-rich protein 2-like isoform X2 [Anser cygnoides]
MCRSCRVLAGSDKGSSLRAGSEGRGCGPARNGFPAVPVYKAAGRRTSPPRDRASPGLQRHAPRPPPRGRMQPRVGVITPGSLPGREATLRRPRGPQRCAGGRSEGEKGPKPTGTGRLGAPRAPGPADNSGAAGAISRRLTPRLAPGLPLPSTPLPECIKGGLQIY